MEQKLTEIPEELRIKLGKYINKFKEKQNLGFNQLSMKSGINPAALNRILNGTNKKINPYLLMKLASALRIDYKELYKIVGYLDSEDVETNVDKSYYEDQFDKIPLFESISAGYGSSSGEIVEYISIPGLKNPDQCYAIRVFGDSMQPTIPEKSIIIIKKDMELCDGDIGAFIVNNEAVVKRYKPSEKYTILLSDNNKYTPLVVNEGDEFNICGKVIRVIIEI